MNHYNDCDAALLELKLKNESKDTDAFKKAQQAFDKAEKLVLSAMTRDLANRIPRQHTDPQLGHLNMCEVDISYEKMTPLMCAVETSNIEFVKELVKLGADVNYAVTKHGKKYTALSRAVTNVGYGNPKSSPRVDVLELQERAKAIVTYLLQCEATDMQKAPTKTEADAKRQLADKHREALVHALMIAKHLKQEDIIALLLEHGSVVDERDGADAGPQTAQMFQMIRAVKAGKEALNEALNEDPEGLNKALKFAERLGSELPQSIQKDYVFTQWSELIKNLTEAKASVEADDESLTQSPITVSRRRLALGAGESPDLLPKAQLGVSQSQPLGDGASPVTVSDAPFASTPVVLGLASSLLLVGGYLVYTFARRLAAKRRPVDTDLPDLESGLAEPTGIG